MSLALNINNYQALHDWLAENNLLLKPDWFNAKNNIEPYSPLWAVYSSFGKNKLHPSEWAMHPNWVKGDKTFSPLTIARAESVYNRVSFKALIKRYRALIPVNGFIARSLQRNADGDYSMFDCAHIDAEAFALAALYQFNVDGNMQVVLLTKAVKLPLTHKMIRLPLVVPSDKVTAWLEEEKKAGIAAWIQAYTYPAAIVTQLIQ